VLQAADWQGSWLSHGRHVTFVTSINGHLGSGCHP
jgi:hypothetical protein